MLSTAIDVFATVFGIVGVAFLVALWEEHRDRWRARKRDRSPKPPDT